MATKIEDINELGDSGDDEETTEKLHSKKEEILDYTMTLITKFGEDSAITVLHVYLPDNYPNLNE